MNAHVNENCIGCGMCAGICPEVFDVTDENMAAANEEILPEQEAAVQEAAGSCPVSAIEIQTP